MNDSTPLMKQYQELKAQVPDALLFFRMGDFYELFGEDAVTASEILEITLTSRDRSKPNPIPMAGVPHHSSQGYIQKLLNSGKKVAIGEQMEDPDMVKGSGKIVRREIVRILTPAVQFDSEGSEANYLATLTAASGGLWVLTCLEPSTGETLISRPLGIQALACEFQRLSIRHYLHWDLGILLSDLSLPDNLLTETLPKNYLSLERAAQILKNHYEIESLEAFFESEASILGLGTLVTYVLRTQQQEKIAHLRLPEPLQKPKALILGPSTAQHLDLQDLFKLIHHTRSTLGNRQLKRWMWAPLNTPAEILERQMAVQEVQSQWAFLGEKISHSLAQIYDLERICGRVNTQLANPRDTWALGQSLSFLPNFKQILSKFSSPLWVNLNRSLESLSESLDPLIQKIITTQKEDPPLVSREGGIFKLGTHPELDRLLSLTDHGQKWLLELEARERELTQIPSLKVRYNRVFGYYIEVTQTHLKNVPAHYQRKQTMVGAERFFTEELKKFEEEILTASMKQKTWEQDLFLKLLTEIQLQTSAIMQAARVLGEIDALVSLAKLGLQPGWTYPSIDDSLDLEIHQGRHPVIDSVQRGKFVPNDMTLSPTTRLTLLITGPNMGGKSTVMRQTALIIILGQMGAPVPAKKARWGAVSSLFTRIGAQDAIARGQSTFMVEMSELAHILHHSNEKSLIILDEIGRGTSTYDGVSVAWATLEWICQKIQARTLFATHYHELIPLSQTLPLLANAHLAVEGTKASQRETLRFLYELKEGPTNESFGIHVAQLAGLPKSVIRRAWEVLSELEAHAHTSHGTSDKDQLSLFHKNPEPILEPEDLKISEHLPALRPEIEKLLQELKNAPFNEMTPIQALNFLSHLQKTCPSLENEREN